MPSVWKSRASVSRGRQHGYALLIMLVFLVLGALYGVLDRLSATQTRTEEGIAASGNLQLARQALLAFAVTYRENNANQDWGYLPCPDTDGDGVAESSCGSSGTYAVGLLPYKTLGLGDLREADGNCLWYAVSGGFKNSPKASPLNWDTQGDFTIQSASGATLQAPNDSKGGAVAVVLAPGAPLTNAALTQTRSATTYPCRANPSETTAYLENSNTTYIQGIIKDSSGAITHNDQLVWLTNKDIFDKVRQRSDFATYLNTGITAIQSALSGNLATYPPGTGNTLPTTKPSGLSTANQNFYGNWSDQFRYYRCATAGSYCYTLASQQCDGALLFSGIDGSEAPRSTSARSVGNYFESSGSGALAIANGGYTLNTLADSYFSSTPSQDLTYCLTPKPNNITGVASFQSPSGSNYAVVSTSASSGTSQLTLGTTSSTTVYGCSWYPSAISIATGLRVYFRFNIQNRGEGFVLTLADSTTNSSYSMCGATGGSLGYSGNNGFTNPINSPKIGLEFDTRTNGGQSTNTSTSYRGDPNQRHAAFVFWAGSSASDDLDNKHGACATAGSPCNPSTAPGLQSLSALNSTDTDIYVRLDIVPDSSVAKRYNLYAYITSSTYVKSVCSLDSLSQDVSGVSTCSVDSSSTPTTLTATLDTTMTSAYLGFTFGQTAGETASNEVVVIDNVQIQSR